MNHGACPHLPYYKQYKVLQNLLYCWVPEQFLAQLQRLCKTCTTTYIMYMGANLRGLKPIIHADMTDSLSLEHLLSRHGCTSVIKSLANYSYQLFESKHINYLMVKNEMPGSGVVQTLSCHLSRIFWKKLIKQNHLEYDAMKVIVAQGGLFKSHDIQVMIKVYEDNAPMLELVMNYCIPKPTNRDLCKFSEQALTCKKFGFTKVLISCGARLNVANMLQELSMSDILSEMEFVSYIKSTAEGRVGLFFKALEYSEYDFAESLVSGTESESVASKISLSSVLAFPFQGNWEAFVSVVKALLENGTDPNGSGEVNPLDITLSLPKVSQTEKIELLTLLLQQGAAFERCTYQGRNKTTLLHIATKFAVNSGKSSVSCTGLTT